jgi:lipopolysaccharide/colanic/teichoic acid biosynthesis glycosyltransferase
MKRLLDLLIIILASPALFFAFPLISLIILVSNGKPVLYSHNRTGKDGRIFIMYKFRTMDSMSDESIHEEHYKKLAENKTIEPSLDPSDPIRIENDVRVTNIGNFLRKTSLDELPNLLNVFVGHMSLVGPRPLVPYESSLYGKYEKKRNSTLPGITGLAQVQGRKDLSLQERLYWDIEYIENRNALLDMKIIFMTIKSVFLTEGAN